MSNEKPCAPPVRAGRLGKARQFLAAAQAIGTLDDDGTMSDAYVTLCVHAGIAAADVICCARLGVHSQGDNHQAAVTLLARADRDAAGHLKALLDMKTRSGYGPTLTSANDRKRAGRAATALVSAAESV